jgi:hypothetical protein
MTEVGLRAARALDAGAASGFTRSVPKESPRAEEAPETREYRGTGSSARMYASARLYAPPAMRQNVNATTVNALVAATLAASAPTPEPYPVYAVDEDGNELIDEPPVRRVPMRRRLTVPRGLLGAYDIVTRMDEPEDPATDAEDELEGDDGAVLNPALDAKRETNIFDLRSATATKDAVLRHARATCPAGLAALPLTRELYPGDAERDAAVLLARATHDGKAQTARLREREKKLGLGKRLTEKKRERGGSRRGRGSGSGRGSGRTGRGSGRAGRGSFVYEHANASSGDPAANLGGDSDDVSRSEAEFFSAEDALTDEGASQ